MNFQRARSDEQRDIRRRTILTAAATMLKQMPVAKLSLNELSRRVGLAKSNVLRYFESREAVLLELLNSELEGWIEALDFTPIDPSSPVLTRANQVAGEIGRSLAARPILCDLVSAQASVLEHNVSTTVILRHKRAVNDSVERLTRHLIRILPEFDAAACYELITIILLMTGGAWPQSKPPEAVLAAYAEDVAIAAHRIGFADFLQRTISLTIAGQLSLRPAA